MDKVNDDKLNENDIFKNRKMLLVDDDEGNTYALSKRLRQIGVNVTSVSNGKEALELLRQDPTFELILMDIMMPIMDGIEATRRVRNIDAYHKTPIIALTAINSAEDLRKCLRAGASEYLTKPIAFEKLLAILRICLY
ncbi:MAG: response regulator [Lentisphaeraceae bacterium]|nr:response regulator [Lentisphaeraceae bacterium]